MSSQKIEPLLDIAIVAYRSRDMLRDCLESLFDGSGLPRRVVVVDNDSGDRTAQMVREGFPEVELLEQESNIGFAAATNAAIRHSRAPYVLALNPDTRVPAGVLDRLLELMEVRPEIGICGCRLEREDGSFDHAARRSFPTPLGALGYFLRIDRHGRLAQYRAPDVERGPVDAVNGAFMLIRRAALDEVGLFDEGYWMYMEDLDLCYRFAQAGWTTWYEPAVTVTHVKAGTSGRYRRLRLNYAFHYGMFRFYRKHYAGSRSRLVNWSVYAGIALKLALSAAASAISRHALRRQ